MAAVTTGISFTNTVASPNTSAGFTPALNDLLVVQVWSAYLESEGVSSLSSSIGGFTFTKLFQQQSGATNAFYNFWVADALVSSATSQTVTWDTVAHSNGVSFQVHRVSGLTRVGASAIRQFKAGEVASGNTPALTFDTAALTGNPVIGAVGNQTNPATMTAPGSWTETHDAGHATPTRGLELITRDSGFTGTTVTWGSTTATDCVVAIIELDTSLLGQPTLSRYRGIPGIKQIASHFGRGW